MSYKLTDWAIKQKIPDRERIVLTLIATYANDKGECFPSFETLMEVSGKSRSTLFEILSSLKKKGLIADIKVQGKAGFLVSPKVQISGLQSGNPDNEQSRNPDSKVRESGQNSPEIRTSPLQPPYIRESVIESVIEPVHSSFSSANASEKEGVDAQARDPHPKPESTAAKKGQDSEKPAPKKRPKNNLAAKPDEFSDQVWDDLLTLRRAKHAPLTQTAWDGFVREAGKADITPEEAVRFTITQGWQAFHADGYKRLTKSRASPQQQPQQLNRAQQAEQRLDDFFEAMEKKYGPIETDTSRVIDGETVTTEGGTHGNIIPLGRRAA